MQKLTETTHRSVAWIKKANDDGYLEMKPPFQRNPAWSTKQQGALIETILLEYPIPEIYMQDIVNEFGDQRHIIVDGQQRIRSILDYIAGRFDISEEGCRWSGMYFDDLSAEDKQKIYEYKLVTRIIPAIADEQIKSIFQRINRNNVALNAQELRHATYWGDFIKLMEEITDLDYWTDFALFSPNDRRRMLDVEFVSELCVAYLNGLQNKKTKLEDYYQLYENEFDQKEEVRNIFIKTLGEIDKILPDIRKTRFKKKSDFYTLFLVMADYQKTFPLDRESRTKMTEALVHFGESIDKAIRGLDVSAAQAVIDYAQNVERAASDLGPRRTRHRVLQSVIEKALKPDLVAV